MVAYWAIHTWQKPGTRITASQLALGKKFLCPQHWILNYGRDLHQEKITRIIWFITTGIGSGIGAQVKPVTMGRMKLIAVVGSLGLIFPQKLLPPGDDMHLKMTGKLPIPRWQALNLERKQQ